MGSVAPGNDPFQGGSITRTGGANVSGGLPSANTSVSSPADGVNPTSISKARNNQGSNVGVPYTRLVPLSGRDSTGLGPSPRIHDNTRNERYDNRKNVTETEDLHGMRIAFILGKRSAGGLQPLVNGISDGTGTKENMMTSVGYDLHNMAPGMPGTERFHKLCSFEYLSRYFTNTLWSKGIKLNNDEKFTVQNINTQWTTGVPRMVRTAMIQRFNDRYQAVSPDTVGNDMNNPIVKSTIMNMCDVGKLMCINGSDVQPVGEQLKQGIFCRDHGPFLRGKGNTYEMVDGTPRGFPFSNNGQHAVDPFHVSRCTGDELSFALFDQLLEDCGFSDWRPDGIVLSKGVDDPSDTLSDEYLKSRDGELYNVRIQGPAVTSTWTGDPALEVMTLDRVFVVMVADVWWGDLNSAEDSVRIFVEKVCDTNDVPTSDQLHEYLEGRNTELQNNIIAGPNPVDRTGGNFNTMPDIVSYPPLEDDFDFVKNDAQKNDELLNELDKKLDQYPDDLQKKVNEWVNCHQFKEKQKRAYINGKETTRMCNFRVKLATSSQMVNYSALQFDSVGRPVGTAKSRMGLRIGRNGGEYIVGGWCIGNVLDTAASRAAFQSAGSNIGVRTAPNTMAINLNVKVEWWDSDRMWRNFMNVDSSITPRYIQTKPLVKDTPDGKKPDWHDPDIKPLYSAPNMSPDTALRLRGAYPHATIPCYAIDSYADADPWTNIPDYTENGSVAHSAVDTIRASTAYTEQISRQDAAAAAMIMAAKAAAAKVEAAAASMIP